MVLSKKTVGELVKKARNIKSQRMNSKYTQALLAKDINKSQGYIGDIESGRTFPSLSVLDDIARACDVPLSFFGELSDVMEKTPIKYRFFLSQLKRIMEFQNSDYQEMSENLGVTLDELTDLISSIENNTCESNKKIALIIEKIKKCCNNEILGLIQDLFSTENSIINQMLFSEETNFHKMISFQDIHSIPLYGSISAGSPIGTNENIECFIPTDKSFISETREYFYLTVVGDSMDKEFKDGSLVLVQKQDFVSNGEIGVVLIDGLDATVKKVVIDENLITLVPCSNNPEHLPKTYDMKAESVQILGKVVLAMKKYV